MSQNASHTPVTVAWPGESQNPAVAEPPLIPLVNEHVQSTHCVSLKPDHINQGLNFKGQVPSPETWEKKTWSCKSKGPHTAQTPQLLHLTLHFCWWTTHHSVSPRPHSRSLKANKRPCKTSHQALAWFDGTTENHTPVTQQTTKQLYWGANLVPAQQLQTSKLFRNVTVQFLHWKSARDG